MFAPTNINIAAAASLLPLLLLLLVFLLQMMVTKLTWTTISIFTLDTRKLSFKIHTETFKSTFLIEYVLLCYKQLPIPFF